MEVLVVNVEVGYVGVYEVGEEVVKEFKVVVEEGEDVLDFVRDRLMVGEGRIIMNWEEMGGRIDEFGLRMVENIINVFGGEEVLGGDYINVFVK